MGVGREEEEGGGDGEGFDDGDPDAVDQSAFVWPGPVLLLVCGLYVRVLCESWNY